MSVKTFRAQTELTSSEGVPENIFLEYMHLKKSFVELANSKTLQKHLQITFRTLLELWHL